MNNQVDGFWQAGFWDPSFWSDGFWQEPATTTGGGIVKYRLHEDNDRLALNEWQRRRRERIIEDEDILAVIIAAAHRILH